MLVERVAPRGWVPPALGEMMTDKLVTVHITVRDLRGMLPNAPTVVSTAFWVPLAEFVLGRAATFEIVCQREDTNAIRLLMPLADTIERRRADGALMFWGSMTPAIRGAVISGHGSGHESLWWWQIALERDGEQVFVLKDYGACMDVFGLSDDEVSQVLELLPDAARATRVGAARGSPCQHF